MYVKCAPGTAAGIHQPPVPRVMQSSYAQPGKASHMRTVVRWDYTPDKYALIKVGPRKPTLASKLAVLADHFNAK